MKKFLVSTANAYGYDSNDNLIFMGTTLLDSSIETTLSNTDVRAGQGNQLQYIYYHTAEMNITVSEAQFSLEFLALNVGSTIKVGEDMFTEENVEITNGAGAVSKATPLSMESTNAYGWVTLPGGKVERVTFTNNEFNISDPTYTGSACIRYYALINSARSVTVYADMLPSTIKLVLEATLASSDSTTNKIGKVQIIVPKASMTGAFTLSMTPDAVASTPLSVRALADNSLASASNGCDGNRPIYAKIIELIDGTNWYDGVTALAIEGGDFSLKANETKTLKVYAIKEDGSAPFLVQSDELTFATDKDNIATVTSGVVSAVAEGTAVIKATIPEKEEIDANVVVTVTAA